MRWQSARPPLNLCQTTSAGVQDGLTAAPVNSIRTIRDGDGGNGDMKSRRKYRLRCARAIAITVALGSLSGLSHAADSITFDSQTHRIFAYFPTTFDDSGFRFTFAPVPPYNPYGTGPVSFAWLWKGGDSINCPPNCVTNGTTAYYSYNASQLNMESIDGSSFTLGALDVAQPTGGGSYGLQFYVTGTRLDGSTVSADFTVSPAHSGTFQTIEFPTTFNELVELNFIGGPRNILSQFAIDNIRLYALPSAAVPEPPALTLMLSGLLSLAWLARRRIFTRFQNR